MNIVSSNTVNPRRRLAASVFLLALTLAACTTNVAKPPVVTAPSRPVPGGTAPHSGGVTPSSGGVALPSGGPALARGMTNYDEGNYGEAASQLKLSLEQRLSPPEQILARKHLAFAYCVTGKDRLCADEFKKLVDSSPSFELDAAEAGHPIWGPVFRRVKTKKAELKK